MTPTAPRPYTRRGAMLPNLLVGFGGALLVVILAGWLAYSAAQRNIAASRRVMHTQDVLGELRVFQLNHGQITAAVRAFLLTGDEQYLSQSQQSSHRTHAAHARLEVLTRDNPVQHELLAELRPELVARQAVLDTAIAAYRAGGTPAVQELAKRSATLSRPQRQIDLLTQRFEDNENALLETRVQEDVAGTQRLRTTMGLFLLSTIALLAFLFTRARRDYIERDRAEAEAETQRRFLESVIENLPNMLFIKDAQSLAYVRMNRAGEELLGMPRQSLLGKTNFDFFPPETAEKMTATDREVLAGGTLAEVDVERLYTQRGLRYLHTKKVPILDEHGTATYLLGISEDITERRAFEERLVDLNRRLERNSLQLEAANRELESFSYSVSHDLRAPLRAMDGYAGLIEEDCLEQLNEEGKRYLAAVRDSARRMGTLIDDLLTFSRLSRQQMLPGPVSMNRIAELALEDLRAADPGLATQFNIGALPDCFGDERLLSLVWMNLLENAAKYSGRSRTPRVDVQGERRDEEFVYQVRDNGVGFDMRYYDKLFSVFQRLHSDAEFPGTGVGLATVHRIVSRHHGKVWAKAIPGEGATFFFSLPITPVATDPAEESMS